MSEFFVGQKVVCILDCGPVDIGETCPSVGGIYTIRDIDAEEPEGLYFTFVEIINPDHETEEGAGEAIFFEMAFRPLEEKTDSIELFREIARGVSDGKPIIEDAEYRLPTPEKVRA